jgi:ornithine cyclodeaminase/alanine dehydrogenase-like protein (mu-crystallin family)
MLILNSNDIYKACYLPDVIKAIEKAYFLQANNNYVMPDRIHLIIKDDIQLVMPSAAEGMFCTKLVTVNQKNTLKNLPIINGSVQLTRQSDGQLLSLMNGSALTAIRTGAVGAVAAKYLANKNSSTVGLIGTGIQGLHLLWLISEVLQVDQFYIFNYKAQQTQKFKLDLEKKIPGVKTEVVNDREELVKLL